MADKEFHLSVLDQNGARVYNHTLLVFPFPNDSEIETAIEALANGLQYTVAKLPFLAGKIYPPDPKTGKLSLRYLQKVPDVIEACMFAAKKLTYPDEYTHKYAELASEGMPPKYLPREIFCPDALRNCSGIPPYAEGVFEVTEPVPVLAVQAFFISGGLVLSIYNHHTVMDGSGRNQIMKHFADAVFHRRTAASPLTPDQLVPNQSLLRTQLDARIANVCSSPFAGNYTHEPFAYKKTLNEEQVPVPCSAKLFVFSAANLRAFRDRLKQLLPQSVELTICNVLTAMIWVHITRARAERMKRCGHNETTLAIAVNARSRLNPPFNEDYMGILAMFFAKATMSIEKLANQETVANDLILCTALAINASITEVDDAFVRSHLAFFASKVPIKDTEPALRFRFGPDIYITSWMNFGADWKWGIPGTTSDQPEFLRKVKERSSDGGIIILPRRREVVGEVEKPYEVLVRLATEDMDRLENEKGGLKSWTERVVE